MLAMTEEEEKEKKEKTKTKREKLAGYFYNISQLTFAAMVLGGLSPIFGGEGSSIKLVSVVFGLLMTIATAYMANLILKQ